MSLLPVNESIDVKGSSQKQRVFVSNSTGKKRSIPSAKSEPKVSDFGEVRKNLFPEKHIRNSSG